MKRSELWWLGWASIYFAYILIGLWAVSIADQIDSGNMGWRTIHLAWNYCLPVFEYPTIFFLVAGLVLKWIGYKDFRDRSQPKPPHVADPALKADEIGVQ